MAVSRRRNVIASRRKRDDDGEEEGSLAGGDIEDDSLSEGFVSSIGEEDADIEGSEISADDETNALSEATTRKDLHANGHARGNIQVKNESKAPAGHFVTSKDTEAMMNGLQISDTPVNNKEINFEDTATVTPTASQNHITQNKAPAPIEKEAIKNQDKVIPIQSSATEHNDNKQAYLKEMAENPTFVPNRGGFFLHDNRISSSGVNGFRGYPRGRGRAFGAYGGPGFSRLPLRPEPSSQQWAHDLHDSVSSVDPTASSVTPSAASNIKATNMRPFAPPSNAPNRSFSTTTVLGKVAVGLYLPWMAERKQLPSIPKKQHTLLPQHRPPLRRDKPVRVSIAGTQPRFIFPTVERSFIFIPRALRPNQQGYGRRPGKGSQHGSRRTSVYGGSIYSPSIAMSRRSSIAGGMSRDSLRSPTGSVLSRPPMGLTDAGKPVVRLPPAALINGAAVPAMAPPLQAPQTIPLLPQSNIVRENRPASIPMHQPRPQKTVSVADIESPASISINAPQQQQEQPFHQQVPQVADSRPYNESQMPYTLQTRQLSHPSQPSGTPLSQIPEGAIHAQPFQPYPMAQPQGYFVAYPPGTVFYPPPVAGEYPTYTGNMAAPATAPTFVSSSSTARPIMVGASSSGEQQGPPATVAHESNGMVYYFDPSQLHQQQAQGFAPAYTMPPTGGVVGMGGMMTPPGGYYYPQATPGPVYYAPQ